MSFLFPSGAPDVVNSRSSNRVIPTAQSYASTLEVVTLVEPEKESIKRKREKTKKRKHEKKTKRHTIKHLEKTSSSTDSDSDFDGIDLIGKDFLYLPNGQLLIQDKEIVSDKWYNDRKGDREILLYDSYRLDIPNYDIWNGTRSINIEDIIKLNHTLPSGIINDTKKELKYNKRTNSKYERYYTIANSIPIQAKQIFRKIHSFKRKSNDTSLHLTTNKSNIIMITNNIPNSNKVNVIDMTGNSSFSYNNSSNYIPFSMSVCTDNLDMPSSSLFSGDLDLHIHSDRYNYLVSESQVWL